MSNRPAQQKFQRADALYKDQRFEESLAILDALDKKHPNNRHILFPKARCLAELQRDPEALELTQQIIERFDYTPAKELQTYLQQRQPAVPSFDLEDLDNISMPGVPDIADAADVGGGISIPNLLDDIPVTAKAPPPLPAQSTSPEWVPVAAWIGLAVASYAIFVVVMFYNGAALFDWMGAAETAETLDDLPPFPVGPFLLLLLAGLPYQFLVGCFCAYLALLIVKALPYEDFGPDMKDIALYSLYCLLLSPFILIGWIIALVILKRHYDLTVGKLALLVLLYIAIGAGLGGFLNVITGAIVPLPA